VFATYFRQTLIQTQFCVRHLFQSDPDSDPVLCSPSRSDRLCNRRRFVIATSLRFCFRRSSIQSLPGVKKTKCETYSSYPFRFEIKKERILNFTLSYALNGHALTQLIEAVCYKPEGHGFDTRQCHWNFSRT
jgi:hypothetical protein